MCNETAGNSINDDEIRNENRFLIFVFDKKKIENRPNITVTVGEGKSGSGVTANKMAVVL